MDLGGTLRGKKQRKARIRGGRERGEGRTAEEYSHPEKPEAEKGGEVRSKPWGGAPG